jgi:peptide deformylase
MKLPLAYYGDPILRKKCVPIIEINEELKLFIKDMEETLIDHQGYGLAAPQVHRAIALFLINIPIEKGPEEWEIGPSKIFINPKILEHSKEEWLRGEGCLSIPEVYGTVSRPNSIKVEAMNLEGELFIEELSGMEARAFMHENDHINGVLFIDRVRGEEREELDSLLRQVKKRFSKKQ